MLMYKKIIALMLALNVISVSAFAAQTETNPEKEFVVISGNIDMSAQVKEVSVIILNPGKTIADLNNGDISAVAFAAQVPVRTSGAYSIKAKLSGASGEYSVYVDYEGNTDNDAEIIRYITAADNKAAIEALFGANSSGDAADVMNGRWTVLGISNEFYDMANCSAPAKIFYGLKTEMPVAAPTLEDTQRYFDMACAIAAISEGKIDDLADYLEILDLTDTAAAGYYKKGNSSMKKAVKTRLQSAVTAILGECAEDEAKWKNIKASFDETFAEAVVLATVEHPGGVGDVTDVIKDFSGQIGIGTATDNSKVYYALMSRKFDTYGALLSAYRTAVGTENSSDNAGGGGGGGVVRGDSANAVTPIVGDYRADSPENIGARVNVFNDIADVSWAIEAIADLTERGVLSGMGDGSFKPDDAVTREQFVKMIVTAFDMQARDNDMAFSDVKHGDWYYDAVKAAYENGIIRGHGDSFGVGEGLTREDMAVIICNTLKKLGISGEETAKPEFIDSAEISDYAKESVEYLKNTGVLKGNGNNDFNPKNVTTRAEASVVIFSLLNNNR